MRIDRRHFLMTAAAGAVSLPGLLAAEVEDAEPEAGATFQNPIIQGDYPDPSIVRVDGRYYMTHSANTYCPAFLLWQSPNLVDWEPLTCALKDYDGDLWAPDLTYFQDKFYLYYTTRTITH